MLAEHAMLAPPSERGAHVLVASWFRRARSARALPCRAGRQVSGMSRVRGRAPHLPSSCSIGSSDTERELSGDLQNNINTLLTTTIEVSKAVFTIKTTRERSIPFLQRLIFICIIEYYMVSVDQNQTQICGAT